MKKETESAPKVTVVIATLGADSLVDTIDALQNSTVIPAEILVCIPEENAQGLDLSAENVKILKTMFRGQVAQRAWGFKNASFDMVLQLDDDIIVDKKCIEVMCAALSECGSNVAVGPTMLNIGNKSSVYKRQRTPRLIRRAYYWLMNGSSGYVPGSIDKSGSAVGVDFNEMATNQVNVEWLPGGCVMHYRDNLVLENFWPLSGKAFYEDVAHSLTLSSRGIRLIIDKRAKCMVDVFPEMHFKFSDFISVLFSDYKARRYVMARFLRKSPRIYFYYLIRIYRYLFKRLTIKTGRTG